MSSNDIATTTTAAVAIEEAATNPYLAEAVEELALIRGLSEKYVDETDPRPLTPAERRLVKLTTAEGLERAALFGDAAPGVGGALANAREMRDINHYIFAKLRVRDEVATLLRRIDDSIARKMLKGVRLARALYNLARIYVKSDVGHSLKPHVDEMKKSLIRPRRRKPAALPGDSTVPVDPGAAIKK